jgi:hypothetical protein
MNLASPEHFFILDYFKGYAYHYLALLAIIAVWKIH